MFDNVHDLHNLQLQYLDIKIKSLDLNDLNGAECRRYFSFSIGNRFWQFYGFVIIGFIRHRNGNYEICYRLIIIIIIYTKLV